MSRPVYRPLETQSPASSTSQGPRGLEYRESRGPEYCIPFPGTTGGEFAASATVADSAAVGLQGFIVLRVRNSHVPGRLGAAPDYRMIG